MIEEFQNVFVRVAVDSAFRSDFLANPERALTGFALSELERRSLMEISCVDLERYAGSLLAKRTAEFSRAIPLAMKVCPSLATRYTRWLETHPSPIKTDVLDPGLSEALRALTDLANDLAKDSAEASYSADLFKFEVLRRCSQQDGQVRFMKAQTRVDLLSDEIRTGLTPMDPDAFPVTFRFDRSTTRWKAQ